VAELPGPIYIGTNAFIDAVQVFALSLRQSIDEFQADPSGPPLVPNWSRVWAGVHDAGPMLMSAVAEGGA